MKIRCIATLAGLCATTLACGQGFINLDFEDAVVEPLPPDNVLLDWNLAAPGWGGGHPLYYREGHLGVGPIHLLMDSTSPDWAPGTQLAGNYSLEFASGYGGNDPSGPWERAGIAQSGSVPDSAQSIRMLATGPFRIFLDDVEIPMFPLGGNSYGGDVSGFAGDTVGLYIYNNAPVGQLRDYTVVDNIEFSPEVIPEPSALGLLGLSSFLLAAHRHYRRRSTP